MDKKIIQISKLSNIPPEVLSNISKLCITDNYSLSIENHNGILYYTDSKVIIKYKSGTLEIEGSDINIDFINKEMLTLNGCIKIVKFENME